MEGTITSKPLLDLLVDLPYVNVEVDPVVCLIRTLVTLKVPNLFMYTLNVLG